MLRNSLSTWVKEQGRSLPHDWERKRAEALSPDDFATLARALTVRTDPDGGE
jgi:16S rRNA (adenine1518-N6/adenine1519-N6)-dimethyltransferase